MTQAEMAVSQARRKRLDARKEKIGHYKEWMIACVFILCILATGIVEAL